MLCIGDFVGGFLADVKDNWDKESGGVKENDGMETSWFIHGRCLWTGVTAGGIGRLRGRWEGGKEKPRQTHSLPAKQ